MTRLQYLEETLQKYLDSLSEMTDPTEFNSRLKQISKLIVEKWKEEAGSNVQSTFD